VCQSAKTCKLTSIPHISFLFKIPLFNFSAYGDPSTSFGSPFYNVQPCLRFLRPLQSLEQVNEYLLIVLSLFRTLLREFKMAVLDDLEGIEVTICVDGQALHEYNDDEIEAQAGAVGAHQASKTVSKYIEAATGKEFAVKVTVKSPYKMDCPTLSFRCRVDGMKVGSRGLQKTGYKSASGFETVVNGLRHNLGGLSKRCSIRHFQFAEIKTSTSMFHRGERISLTIPSRKQLKILYSQR
jgi:hypothetical protein